MAKKLESNFINMVVVLLTISFISSAALAIVFEKTKTIIWNVGQEKKLRAISEVVVAGYTNNPLEEKTDFTFEGETYSIFPAKKDNQLTSVAILSTSNRGYSGDVTLMVGILPDGTLNQISVIEQKETPGLGTKMAEPTFLSQFLQKNPETYKLSVKKDGGDVDAITAATISSRAFSHAVLKAYQAFKASQRGATL